MAIIEKLAAVRKPEENLKDGLLSAYLEIAKGEGYGEEMDKGVALFLVKEAEKIAVEVQFGNKYEIFESIKRLYGSGAGMCVLVTSSLVRSVRFGELGRLLLDAFSLGTRKFAFIDVESGRVLRVNFEQIERRGSAQQQKPAQPAQPQAPNQPRQTQQHAHHAHQEQHVRRKIIHGKRGEHKEQD